MKKSLKGVGFGILVFLSSLLGAIFLLFPLIPLAYFAPKLWRVCADRLVGFWLTFPCSFIEWIAGVQFRVTGDIIHNDEPSIILMNHRTRLDWLFLWNCLYKIDPWLLTTEKISLKAPLKKIPGAGWAMSCGTYIFLDRNFEKDRTVIKDIIDYYSSCGKNYQILLFAEGTDKGKRATELSDKYADKMGLEKYEYVLYPRTTGFKYLLDLMKNKNYIQYVYDLTIAYDEPIVDTELKLVKNGDFPSRVHLDIKRYSISEIPAKEEEKWINKIWQEKEKKLKDFYEVTGKLEPSGDKYLWSDTNLGLGYVVAFAFWCIYSILSLWAIYSSYFVQLYSLAAVVFYISAIVIYNGSEFIFLKWAVNNSNY